MKHDTAMTHRSIINFSHFSSGQLLELVDLCGEFGERDHSRHRVSYITNGNVLFLRVPLPALTCFIRILRVVQLEAFENFEIKSPTFTFQHSLLYLHLSKCRNLKKVKNS